jgi:hypothetical protein
MLVRGVLSADECANIIASATPKFLRTGRDYPRNYRDNDRAIHDDPQLAQRIFERIRPFLPSRLTDDRGAPWRLVGLNERFRFCRYQNGQRFCIHRDGAHARGPEERSRLTVMLYLNDATEFMGGATRFFASRSCDSQLLGLVRPETGTAVIFDHDLWHDGEAVTRGTKVVMRTDVMYVGEPAADHPGSIADRAGSCVLRGHTGYVWSVVARRDGTVATGSRDRTIRLWRRSEGAWQEQQRLEAHQASVATLAEAADGALWSGSRDRTIRRWTANGSDVVGEHEGAVLCLVALTDGRVASSGADGTIRLWSPHGSSVAALHGHQGWVWALAPLHGHRLASASEDGTIRLWCLSKMTEIARTKIRGSVPTALAARGDELACGHDAGQISRWQATPHGQPRLRQLAEAFAHEGAVSTIVYLGNHRIASGGEDDVVRITELQSMSSRIAHSHRAFVRSLALLPGGLLASGGYDCLVRIWSATSNHRVVHGCGDVRGIVR